MTPLRRLSCVALALLVLLLVAAPALAFLYRAPLTITETNGNAYTMLPVSVSEDNQWLADNGFMEADALDTRVETLGGLQKPHLVVDDRTLTAIAVPANSQTNLYFSTGNSDLTAMDIIVGNGGYITMSDAPGLEAGNNFEIELTDAWIDTSAGASKYLVRKDSTFQVYVSANQDVTATIVDPVWTTPTGHVDPDAAWSNEANAYDDDTGTFAQTTAAVPATSWSSFLELTVAAQQVNRVRLYRGASVYGDDVDVDLYYSGGWNDFYQGAWSTSQWNEFTTSSTLTGVTSMRVRIYNEDASVRILYLGEADFGYQATVTASGVATGEHDVKVTADGTNLKIYIDSNEEDSAALNGASVTDNANDWILMDNATTQFFAYLGSYKHTVGGALVTRYEPNAIVVGTTLPDREAAGNDGAITWGSNPAGVSASLSSMESGGQPSALSTTDETPRDVLAPVGVSDWYGDGTVSKAATLNNPVRSVVTAVSNNTALSEIQVWRWLGVILWVAVTASVAMRVRGHQGITAIVSGATIGGLVAFDSNIFPLYLLTLAIGLFLGGVVAERSPSL